MLDPLHAALSKAAQQAGWGPGKGANDGSLNLTCEAGELNFRLLYRHSDGAPFLQAELRGAFGGLAECCAQGSEEEILERWGSFVWGDASLLESVRAAGHARSRRHALRILREVAWASLPQVPPEWGRECAEYASQVLDVDFLAALIEECEEASIAQGELWPKGAAAPVYRWLRPAHLRLWARAARDMGSEHMANVLEQDRHLRTCSLGECQAWLDRHSLQSPEGLQWRELAHRLCLKDCLPDLLWRRFPRG